jgi:hypothetical protein
MKAAIKSLVLVSLLVSCGNDSHDFSRQDSVTYPKALTPAEKYAERTCQVDKNCIQQTVIIYTQVLIELRNGECQADVDRKVDSSVNQNNVNQN